MGKEDEPPILKDDLSHKDVLLLVLRAKLGNVQPTKHYDCSNMHHPLVASGGNLLLCWYN